MSSFIIFPLQDHHDAVTFTLTKIAQILEEDLNRDVTTNVIFHTSSFRYFFK